MKRRGNFPAGTPTDLKTEKIFEFVTPAIFSRRSSKEVIFFERGEFPD